MKVYKITEASEYLGVSINTLKTLARDGRMSPTDRLSWRGTSLGYGRKQPSKFMRWILSDASSPTCWTRSLRAYMQVLELQQDIPHAGPSRTIFVLSE